MEQILELEEPKQQAETQAESNAPAPMPVKDYEARCFEQMGALLGDLKTGELAGTFVRVATWHLAQVVNWYGKRAMTDVLRQIAAHLDRIDEVEAARREADEAKAAGRLPQ